MKITFNIEYFTRWGEELFIMLNNEPSGAVKMEYTPGAIWTVTIDVSKTTRQLLYRYMVKENGQITRVERCAGHLLTVPRDLEHYRVVDNWDDTEPPVANDFISRLMGNSGTVRHRVALSVDVMALRSDRDMGAGDLGDLKKVVRWAQVTGHDAVMLQSLADGSVVEGWMPAELRRRVMENAIDPIYLCPSLLGSLIDKKLKSGLQKAGIELNAGDDVRCDTVRALKLNCARAMFDQVCNSVTRTAGYRRFVAENASWLPAYATQLLLRLIKESADVSQWGNYAHYEPIVVERFLKARHREAALIYYVQYQLRQQLMEAANGARKLDVNLMCDMTAPRQVKSFEIREPWLNERAIKQRMSVAPGMAVIPLRDWLLIDDVLLRRIVEHSGSRLPVCIEELIANSDLNARIHSVITNR